MTDAEGAAETSRRGTDALTTTAGATLGAPIVDGAIDRRSRTVTSPRTMFGAPTVGRDVGLPVVRSG
ncbi:MAG: hypothetical protein ABI678_26265, partial [Kofleriaceae bacterium]